MHYKTLHHVARQIDRLIDANLPTKNSTFLPQDRLKKLVKTNFSDFYVISYGWHKAVFGIRSLDHKVVLKVGTKKAVEYDHRAYKRLPDAARHRLFARIFWHTKYCLLQEYGFPAHVTSEELAAIRSEVYRYGIFDVKSENLKQIDGELKIIDANVTSIPAPTLLRKFDEIKPKLPKQLVLAGKKISKRLYGR